MATKEDRPLTQREIRKAKQEKRRGEEKAVIVHNISKQTIPLQLAPPSGVDFYAGEQTISLFRGKSTKLPFSRARMEQLTNLQKAGKIRMQVVEP
jgi:hypothetical protein